MTMDDSLLFVLLLILWFVADALPSAWRKRHPTEEIMHERFLLWLNTDLPIPDEPDWDAFEREIEKKISGTQSCVHDTRLRVMGHSKCLCADCNQWVEPETPFERPRLENTWS